MDRKHNKKLTSLAKAFRKNMTKEEKHLWYDFLRKYPVKFLRQRPIGKQIVDFYSAEAKLVIEVDGSQHYVEENEEKDIARTEYLKQYGLKVIRITNKDINANFINVCEYVDSIVKQSLPH